jgi:1-phosphatidylinositol-4-phosphate 5-kinase
LTTIKERVTEGGASGAFFFYSKSEEFIAKSSTKSEIENLRNVARDYSEYVCKEKHTYLTKIYGVYMLQIYGTSLYFLVMNNLFMNKRRENINEKYDIKGSTVNRNAALPEPGDTG